MMEFAGFGSQPRGLQKFIAEIRSAKNKEEEHARVDKELGNIRAKFSSPANLTSYDKKKYVWKMCYIYMLGYEVDFGHVEFISLLSSTKYTEKSVGYMAFSLMFRPGDELLKLAMSSLRNDLIHQNASCQTLALSAISNMCGTEIAESLCSDVIHVLDRCIHRMINGVEFHPQPNQKEADALRIMEQLRRDNLLVLKKSCLCMVRMFRTNPECVDLEDWVPRLTKLIEANDLGIVISTMSLLQTMAEANTTLFEPLTRQTLIVLNNLVNPRGHNIPQDYLYYNLASPWLQIKCLRFLQLFPIPHDQSLLSVLNEVVTKILSRVSDSNPTDNHNKSNAIHSILFEAINLIMTYGVDAPPALREEAKVILCLFVSSRDANIRYLGIESLTRMLELGVLDFFNSDAGKERSAQLLPAVLDALKEGEISLGKKALRLLYAMAFEGNAQFIVEALVECLAGLDAELREDIVIKVAILAERYRPSTSWYLDRIFQAALFAGEQMSQAVWHRAYHLVIADTEVHGYAAEKCFSVLQSRVLPESTLCLAAVILGEVGMEISEMEGRSGGEQLVALHKHFPVASPEAQALLFTAYVKMVNLYPEQVKDAVMDIFRKHSSSSLLELQQRACEYLVLSSDVSPSVLEEVLNLMPVHQLGDESKLMIDQAASAADKALFGEAREKTGGMSVKMSSSVVTDYDQNKPDTPPQAELDLLGLDDDLPSPPAAAAPAFVGESDFFPPQMRAFSQPNTLITLNLSHFKVQYKCEPTPPNAVVNYAITNTSGSPMSGLSMHIDAPDGLSLTSNGAELPTQLAVGEVAYFRLSAVFQRPFDAIPTVKVVYTVNGGTQLLPLTVPVSLATFCTPLPGDKDTFVTRWKAAEKGEVQQVFTSSIPLTAANLVRIHDSVLPGLSLARGTGLDSPAAGSEIANTFTGSATLVSATKGPDGKNLPFGCLLRLEADMASGKYRATVRATHPMVATAYSKFIVKMLGSA